MASTRRVSLFLVLIALVCILPGLSNAQESLNSTTLRPSSSLRSSNSTRVLPSATTSLAATSVAPSTTSPPSSTALPSSSSISPPPLPPFLDTHIEGWSGALGALLILSGLSLSLWGVKSRWTSFFLVGFWSAATVVGLLILRLGVENAIHPPSASTRGLYLFASLAGGVILGGACVMWWSGAHYLCGAMGGFLVGLFILALRSNGLIQVAFGKYILLIGLAALGFAASCFGRLQHAIVLFGTASVGSTALVLGIDCFTSANLKEFYIYNVGISVPRRLHSFPHTTAIQVELGVLAAAFLCSLAFQWKGYTKLVSRIRELKQADLERDRKEDMEAQRRRLSGADLEQWEEKHGNRRSAVWSKVSEETLSGIPPNPSQIKKGSMEFLPELRLGARMGKVAAPSPLAESPTPSKWTNYLTSRKIFVDDREKPKPAARRPSDLEKGRRYSSAPTPELPLPRPLSTALPRAPSPATLPRPISAATLNPLPRPTNAYDFPSAEPTSRPVLPSRHSSALSRPLSLPFSSDYALDAPASRRRTMLDLSEDDMPLGEALHRNRRRTMQGVGATEKRIIVADWHRKEVAQPKPAKIMDMAELEAKKRKALGQIQASASFNAKAAALRAQKEQGQQREAEEQRRRSLSSAVAFKNTRRNSIGTLLDRLDDSSSPSPSRSASADRLGPARRDSSPALFTQQPPTLGERGRTRSVPLAARRESARISGIGKVDEWKRQSMMDVRVDEMATKPAVEKPKKKHDWLGY